MGTVKRHSIASFKKAFDIVNDKQDYFFKQFDENSNYPEEPYRTETYGIGFVKQGQLHLTTGLTAHDVQAPAIITMGPHVIRQWMNTYKSSLVQTVFFKQVFIQEVITSSKAWQQFIFFDQPDLVIHQLNDTQLGRITDEFNKLIHITENPHKNQRHLVQHQIASICYLIDGFENRTVQSQQSISAQFKELVSQHISKHHDVQFYADALHISPKQLFKVIKKDLGRTPIQVLQQMLILEAKILLQQQNVTSSETAYKLNFPDPSSFGKYFKKYAGISPSVYQKENMTS